MITKLLNRIDNARLWLLGFILEIIVFIPYDIMGEASVFTWHDQMDENILNYVITARHLGDGLKVFPEMMGGLPASALQPYSYLLTLLYRVFDPFAAFLFSYAIIFAMSFFGMYFLVKTFTRSSIASLISAGLFAMLPFYPVYGAAVAGVPLCVYAIKLLSERKKIVLAYFLLALFTLMSHLVFTGYGVLGFWLLFLIYKFIRKDINRFEVSGFIGMIILYVLINIDLFKEMLFGLDSYVSHREEFVRRPTPFGQSFMNVFMGDGEHAFAGNKYLIIPVVAILAAFVVLMFLGKLEQWQRKLLFIALIEFAVIFLICVFYGFWNCGFVTDIKNSSSGLLRYFQLDRFYWLLPALWYSLLGICIAIPIKKDKFDILRYIIWALVLLPSVILVRNNSPFYMSVNQLNNGSNVTGYITWEAYYSEEVFEDIEKAIGKDMSTYRVGHIGICPAPALMHGFYTIDGYAGSYPLSYKHAFREIIADELALSPASAEYFDTWGSRCYLYNSQSGTSYMNGKASEVKYEGLKYNYDLLKDLGCEYLFSCGEIVDANDENLEILGVFSNDTAYWKIWVYRLK